jgi:soluble lytic murein transglycosylase
MKRRRRRIWRPRRRQVVRHRGNNAVKVFTLCLAVLCVLVLVLSPRYLLQRPSPQVAAIITDSAEAEQLSPELLEAVMLTESKFDETAVSHVGAVGMMQLMPETAHWIAEESGLPADQLDKPEQNIPLGAWYLEYLLKKYNNNEVLALAAYNAGRGNVDQWMKEKKWGKDFHDISQIPFPETREFVKTVTTSRDRILEDEGKKGNE